MQIPHGGVNVPQGPGEPNENCPYNPTVSDMAAERSFTSGPSKATPKKFPFYHKPNDSILFYRRL